MEQASDLRIQVLQLPLEVRLIFLRSGVVPVAALVEQMRYMRPVKPKVV